MKRRMLAIVVMLVVGTIVITGGVMLFGMRHQLFRPDLRKSGGTEISFELADPASDEAMSRACVVLRKRFDDDGRAGVEVERDGEKRIAIRIPNSRMHESLMRQVERLACTRGHFFLTLVPSEDDDRPALEQAERLFLDGATMPVVGDIDGGAKVTVQLGTDRRTFRWYRVTDGMANHWLEHRAGVAGRAAGRRVETSAYNLRLYAEDAPGRSASYYVPLSDEPEARISAGSIQRVRLTSGSSGHGPRQTSTLELTLDDATALQLRSLTAKRLTKGRGMYSTVVGVLDGEVVMGMEFYREITRKQQFYTWGVTQDAEDLTALIRGGELPVKLAPKSARDNPIAPSR